MTFSIFQVIAAIISLGIIGIAVKNARFSELLNDKKLQHRMFGAATALFVLWLFRVSIEEGLTLQFLGVTAFTLTLGFRWSVIAGSLVVFAVSIIEGDNVADIGIQLLFMMFVPILFSYAAYMLSFHKLPKNVFTFIFGCGFFPGGISIALAMLMMSGYFYLSGQYPWYTIYENYLQLVWLLMFQEAFFNGMIITCLVVYKPHWLYTYNDKFYLDGK